MIRVLTEDPARWMRTQSPKEYVQMMAAASEALRKATMAATHGSGKGKSDVSRGDLLDKFRAEFFAGIA